MTISKEAAESTLGSDTLESLRRCVARGVESYFKGYTPEQRTTNTRRTRASTIHDLMRREAERTFGTTPGTRCMEVHSLFVVNFGDRAVVRCKKLEAGLRSRGHETQQFLEFIEQGELDGIPAGVPHLEVGYVLNALETGYSAVHLVCPDGPRSNSWTIELCAPGVVAEVVPLERNEPTDARQARRFRSKLRVVRAEDGEPTG